MMVFKKTFTFISNNVFSYSFVWERHKRYLQNRFVKSISIWLIITPLAAKAFENVENLRIPGLDNSIVLSLPFSWIYLFFASLFLTAAIIFFNIFCPNSISEYNSLQDFKDRDFTSSKIHDLFKGDLTWGSQAVFKNDPIMLKRRQEALKQKKKDLTEEVLPPFKKLVYGFSENMTAHENGATLRIDELIDMNNIEYSFILLRKLCNYNLCFVRFIISILTLLGFGTITLILLQNVIFVVSYTVL